jgi:uncharacterized repeat protein (TIGR01451 family)
MLILLTRKNATFLMLMSFFCANGIAQNPIRNFGQMYSENLRGGTTMFGNTILHIVNENDNTVNTAFMNETNDANNGFGGIGFAQHGNDNNNMQFTDVDDFQTTINSSSADLILPSGTNSIKFARLYWGGKLNASAVSASPDTLRKIKIRKGTSGAYLNVVSPTNNVDQFAVSTTDIVYQSFVDITNFINSNGSGTYTVADLPATTGVASSGGYFGGWVIVVAYENPTQPYNSIRLYDGFAQVYNSGIPSYLNITLTGLNVPSTPLLASEAVMGTMSWEGDANLGATVNNREGDFIKINYVPVSNEVNPEANFWNGSISRNGSFVDTKNPNYSNQMGIDIDEVNVGTGYDILPNATSVNVEFGTEADMYFPSIFTFCIRVKDPTIVIDKAVTDQTGDGFIESKEELTYTLSGSNQGIAPSYNTYIVDSLPLNVRYIPNTLEIINAPGVTAGFKTDAADNDVAFKGTVGERTYVKFFIGTGATGTNGGILQAGTAGNYAVRFRVKADEIPGSVINTARIYGNSPQGDLFTDDGTAVIGEEGAPMPVTMTSFLATLSSNKQNCLLKWNTESETDNAYFEVQRSNDGVHFEYRGKVAGNGTTSLTKQYDYNDEINGLFNVIYYRLKIIDKVGKYSFSKIIALKINGTNTNEQLNVYPNPFYSDIKIELLGARKETGVIRFITFEGKEVLSRSIEVDKGNNIIVLKDLNYLPRGNYILEVTTSSTKMIRKIIK